MYRLRYCERMEQLCFFVSRFILQSTQNKCLVRKSLCLEIPNRKCFCIITTTIRSGQAILLSLSRTKKYSKILRLYWMIVAQFFVQHLFDSWKYYSTTNQSRATNSVRIRVLLEEKHKNSFFIVWDYGTQTALSAYIENNLHAWAII